MAEQDSALAADHPVAPRPGTDPAASGTATVVALHGEIDVLTAFALSDRLDALTARPHPDLVLDLRAVGFIDCAGLGVLCRARNRVLARDGRLRLVTESASLRRLLRAAGLGGVFELVTAPPRPARGGSGR
ncbi:MULTISPECIES: STAS domain-containing protein [Streptomyces]|uniref:Anti-sigma factor antagonist n=1 Tax=Streptomyces doudnae TaxID=3075536 RepID=A0ABD5EUB3_9ACTN|nr:MULTISPECIES: STAS domain-containing protein [unclassified Streptomyces]MDT0438311.1 STAS domain-containing protein [Streptomyces sp. DSM 41981]MYQ68334.1 anti-sigma factor antagonist [Streptomyces sp. SID4950]SCE45237.1 anti-sigma B factor antagonist [Streptomyces sp. SolWspMP-5a-2]